MQNKLTKILALCFSTGAKRLGSKRLCSQIFNLYRKRKGVLCERVRVVKTVVNLRSSGADSLAPFQRSIRTGQERIGDTLSELALLASFVCEEREILWRKRECVYGVMGCGKSKSATAPSCKLLKPPLFVARTSMATVKWTSTNSINRGGSSMPFVSVVTPKVKCLGSQDQ